MSKLCKILYMPKDTKIKKMIGGFRAGIFIYDVNGKRKRITIHKVSNQGKHQNHPN